MLPSRAGFWGQGSEVPTLCQCSALGGITGGDFNPFLGGLREADTGGGTWGDGNMQNYLERASKPTAATHDTIKAVWNLKGEKKTNPRNKTPPKPPCEHAQSIFVTWQDLARGCLGSGLPLEGFGHPANAHTMALGRARSGPQGSTLPSLGVLLCMGWP